MDYLVNKFNEENTDGITVEAVYQGEYDDTINKLKSAQIGNMGADLVQIYDIGTRFMIDSGWVIPMQELINADGYDISQIEPNIAAYYTVNNELYSMPFNSSTPILYYNKDMFEKAGITEVPTSLEGILAIGDDLKTKGGAGEPLALSIYGWYFEQWLCKQGLSYADNGNGRDAAATAVEFDSNGGALNILNAWKALNDADVATKRRPCRKRYRNNRLYFRKSSDHSWLYRIPETDFTGCQRKFRSWNRIFPDNQGRR